jgi:hypothetical protein
MARTGIYTMRANSCSCVNHLAEEDVVREDLKVIERKNGTT